MQRLRQSGWAYETAANGGLGVGFVVASGGNILLRDPGGSVQSFWYGGVGAGLSVGLRIPRFPKVQLRGEAVSGAGAAYAFPSTGSVFMTPQFRGQELARGDLQGCTMYIDGAAGLVVGGGGSAMLLGMNPAVVAMALAAGPAQAIAMRAAQDTAKAVLFMAGVTAGLQAGAGVAGLLGYMR